MMHGFGFGYGSILDTTQHNTMCK